MKAPRHWITPVTLKIVTAPIHMGRIIHQATTRAEPGDRLESNGPGNGSAKKSGRPANAPELALSGDGYFT
jgi:hypothetical protein